MAEWGVAFAVTCACGAEARQDAGQWLRDGTIGWDSEFSCRACGASMCLGFGADGTPPWVRDPLIARHGTARLRLTDPAAGRVAVLKTLREVWDLTLPQARKMAAQLADPGLSGTLPEVAWLRERLDVRGVSAEITPDSVAAPGPWDPPAAAGRG
ncbi:hypothetical protein [Kitasatospora griseola]|uniref:hypothetical protein n=1 Tax=Kitasatospora griseola TaxID=2064 RepID=UPI000695C34F|nr:hypothetical protein [Kitasatospora griseola]